MTLPTNLTGSKPAPKLPEHLIARSHAEIDHVIDLSISSAPVYPTKVPLIDYWCEGGLQPSSLVLLAARANSGKSTMLNTFAKGLLRNRDVILLWFSIDDTVSVQYRHFIASMARVPIAAVTQRVKVDSPEMEEKITRAIDITKQLSSRMLVYGAEDVRGSHAVIREKIIEVFRAVSQSSGERPQLVVFIDSPRNLDVTSIRGIADSASAQNEYAGRCVKAFLDITVDGVRVEPIVIATEHLRKLPPGIKRPGPDDIKDSVGSQYDANLILMMWNDLAYCSTISHTESPMYFERTDLPRLENGEYRKDPIVEIALAKNKLGAMVYGGPSVALFKFYQEQAHLDPIVSLDEARRYLDAMVSQPRARG